MSIALLIFYLCLCKSNLPEMDVNTTMFETFQDTTYSSNYPFIHNPIFESKRYSGCLRGEQLKA